MGEGKKYLRNANKHINITRKKICKASITLVSVIGLLTVVVRRMWHPSPSTQKEDPSNKTSVGEVL